MSPSYQDTPVKHINEFLLIIIIRCVDILVPEFCYQRSQYCLAANVLCRGSGPGSQEKINRRRDRVAQCRNWSLRGHCDSGENYLHLHLLGVRVTFQCSLLFWNQLSGYFVKLRIVYPI